jgi:hypothetical protein
VAADKSDEQGVLGNLPRSRPGRRSARRGGDSETAAKTAAGAKATPSAAKASAVKASPSTRAKAARAKTKAKAKAPARAAPKPKQARPKQAPTPVPPPAAPESHGGTDPLTGAVRLAGKVAEVGLKTAGSLLKRLPGR